MAASEPARVVRVVAVSPSDVRGERDRLQAVVDELNHGVAAACGCRLSLWRWETDAHPGLHLEGPQGLIDDQMGIEDADVVVGIFWKRFGTPTLGAGSGTEHELRRASAAWREHGRPQVMVYFCERKYMPTDAVAAPRQLRDCCPSTGNGRVLVTTRHRGMAQFGPALHIDAFDEATAVTYLRATPGRADDRDGAARLARALGCLPLALSHASAYCAAGTSFDEYRELLETLPAADLFAGHVRTVASTWQVSIQAAEREAPLARQVLAMAAHLAPDAIPRELFDVLLDDAATIAARKPLLDAFNALHRLSLAQVDDDAVSVHRLLQKTIRDDALQRIDTIAAVSALAAVAAAFPSDRGQPQTWPRCERLLPHALAISAAPLPPGEADQRLVRLLNSASDYLLRADPGVRSLDAARRASEVAQQRLGTEHPDTLDAGGNLTIAYRETGRAADAVQLGQRVLADIERILGPEHPDTVSVRAVLAGAYREAGRSGDAISLGERALAERERILGLRHPDTLSIRGNLAMSYRSAGRTGEAIELEERVLADHEHVLGQDHPHTLRARHHLALSYRAAGRIADAVGLEERLLADSERILGSEHPDTLEIRASLAASYREAERGP